MDARAGTVAILPNQKRRFALLAHELAAGCKVSLSVYRTWLRCAQFVNVIVPWECLNLLYARVALWECECGLTFAGMTRKVKQDEAAIVDPATSGGGSLSFVVWVPPCGPGTKRRYAYCHLVPFVNNNLAEGIALLGAFKEALCLELHAHRLCFFTDLTSVIYAAGGGKGCGKMFDLPARFANLTHLHDVNYRMRHIPGVKNIKVKESETYNGSQPSSASKSDIKTFLAQITNYVADTTGRKDDRHWTGAVSPSCFNWGKGAVKHRFVNRLKDELARLDPINSLETLIERVSVAGDEGQSVMNSLIDLDDANFMITTILCKHGRYSEERDRRCAAFEERQRRQQSTTENKKPDVKPPDTRVEYLERAFQALKAENDVLTQELEVLVVNDPESGDDKVATLSSRIKAEKPKAWCGEFDEIKREMWIRPPCLTGVATAASLFLVPNGPSEEVYDFEQGQFAEQPDRNLRDLGFTDRTMDAHELERFMVCALRAGPSHEVISAVETISLEPHNPLLDIEDDDPGGVDLSDEEAQAALKELLDQYANVFVDELPGPPPFRPRNHEIRLLDEEKKIRPFAIRIPD
ncbi:hypothetical protein JCM3770_003671 [Rhodotorula araucariae]